MSTVALELTRAMLAAGASDGWTVFFSEKRLPGFDAARAVLSPSRQELANKLSWLPRVEAEARLDAILYPYWPSPPWRSRRAPPAAVFVHDLAFRVRPAEVPWQQRLYMGRLLPRALETAAAVIVPSAATRRDLLAHYPLAGLEERVHLVPEGPGLEGVEPGALPAGLSPGFLLAVGTVEPRKNYRRLLAAYRQLPDPPPLVIAGKAGWAFGDTLELLRSEPRVRLLGHVDDPTLLALYRSAAALAFPSLYEGFGLPLLEAMAQGLPALVGDAGALPELAAGAALAVDPLSEEAIAAGLARLLGDSALRAELAAKGRQRARRLTWAAAGKQALRVLRSVAAAGPGYHVGSGHV